MQRLLPVSSQRPFLTATELELRTANVPAEAVKGSSVLQLGLTMSRYPVSVNGRTGSRSNSSSTAPRGGQLLGEGTGTTTAGFVVSSRRRDLSHLVFDPHGRRDEARLGSRGHADVRCHGLKDLFAQYRRVGARSAAPRPSDGNGYSTMRPRPPSTRAGDVPHPRQVLRPIPHAGHPCRNAVTLEDGVRTSATSERLLQTLRCAMRKRVVRRHRRPRARRPRRHLRTAGERDVGDARSATARSGPPPPSPEPARGTLIQLAATRVDAPGGARFPWTWELNWDLNVW